MFRRDLSALPEWVPGCMWLYAVEFEGGIVKVGRTTNPRARLGALYDIGRRRGYKMLGCFVERCRDHYESERPLRNACRAAAKPLEGCWEWFSDLPFSSAIAAVRESAAASLAVKRPRLKRVLRICDTKAEAA